MKLIDEERIVFWTVLALLVWGPKVALLIFAGGLLYNLIASIYTNRKGNI